MDDIERLQEAIGSAKRIVAFTGAGISTESGIPDFRSPGGIWTKYKPIYFDDFMASEEMRRESWRRKFATDETMLKAEPNAGHRALAKLVEQGRMTAIITQNVDGLHQRSGVPDSKIIELHGNTTYASCLDCGHRHELDPIRKAFLGDGKLPLCEKCDGIVKTATISFGQAMPEIQMARAQDETHELRPLHRAGQLAGGLSGGGLPAHRQAQGREAGDRQSRRHRPGRRRRSGDPCRNRADHEQSCWRQLTGRRCGTRSDAV